MPSVPSIPISDANIDGKPSACVTDADIDSAPDPNETHPYLTAAGAHAPAISHNVIRV